MQSASPSASPRHSAERRHLSSRCPSPGRMLDTPGSRENHRGTSSPPRGRAQTCRNLNISRLSSSPSGRGHVCFSNCPLCREDTPRPLLGDYPDMSCLEEVPRPFEDNLTPIECMESSPRPFRDGMDGLEDVTRPLEDVLAGMHHMEEIPGPHGDIFDGIGMDAPSWMPRKRQESIYERCEVDICQRTQRSGV